MKKQKLLIICGPTATGKTGLGLELARKFGGELISCDSRQVYKFMDVVTGKDVPRSFKFSSFARASGDRRVSSFEFKPLTIGYYESEGMRIWGYDLVRPDQPFDVSLYLDFVNRVLPEIWKRGKLPILVGGTGLYLQSVVEPPETVGVPMNEKLREQLKGKRAEELYGLFLKKDPMKAIQMNESDQRNPRRLVRALEVAEYYQGASFPQVLQHTPLSKAEVPSLEGNKSEVLWIGLTVEDREKLYERIDLRVEERLMNDGLVGELDYLIEKDFMRYMPAHTIGYQELIEWMGGEVSFEEMVQKWKFAEHGYARRQLTWFRKQKDIKWFDVTEENYQEKIVKRVEEWYS